MAKNKKETPVTPEVGLIEINPGGFSSEEAKSQCGFSYIRYIMIQEIVKNKTKTFTYPIKEAAAPLRHANKYLLGNQRVIVPGMDTDDNLQYKYSYVGEDIQIHVFWATKKPKLCDKN